MKKLLKVNGAKTLSKKAQRNVKGQASGCEPFDPCNEGFVWSYLWCECIRSNA